MATDEPNKFYWVLSVCVYNYSGVAYSYTSEYGLQRFFELSGYIDNSGSEFFNKSITLEFHLPSNIDFVYGPLDDDEINSEIGNGVGTLYVSLRPNYLKERDAAVEARLFLDDVETFEAIRKQASRSYDHQYNILIEITLLADTLFDRNYPKEHILAHSSLDLSKRPFYTVKQISSSDCKKSSFMRDSVYLTDRLNRGIAYDSCISVLLNEARYVINPEFGTETDDIQCRGKVITT